MGATCARMSVLCARLREKDQTAPLELPEWKSHVETADKDTQTTVQVSRSPIPPESFIAVGASIARSQEDNRKRDIAERTKKQLKKAEDWEVVVSGS